MRAFTFTLFVLFSRCVIGEDLAVSEFGEDYFSDLSDFDFGIVSEDMKHDNCYGICRTSTAIFLFVVYSKVVILLLYFLCSLHGGSPGR